MGALCDSDDDGVITIAELGVSMRMLGQNPTESELHEMVNDIGPDKNGFNFREFLSIMARTMRENDGEEDLIEAFRIFDRDGSGFITSAQVRHVLLNLGERLADE